MARGKPGSNLHQFSIMGSERHSGIQRGIFHKLVANNTEDGWMTLAKQRNSWKDCKARAQNGTQKSTTACWKGDIKTTVSNFSPLEKGWQKKNKGKEA